MKTFKIVFYVATGLFSLLMLFSVGNYIFNHDMIIAAFQSLGYPTYLIYPLATAKLLGLAAIWFSPNPTLREWAYAGFFFNVTMAFFAHIQVADGQQFGAMIAFILGLLSYLSRKKAFAWEQPCTRDDPSLPFIG